LKIQSPSSHFWEIAVFLVISLRVQCRASYTPTLLGLRCTSTFSRDLTSVIYYALFYVKRQDDSTQHTYKYSSSLVGLRNGSGCICVLRQLRLWSSCKQWHRQL